MIYNLYNTVETRLEDFWKLVVARYNSLVLSSCVQSRAHKKIFHKNKDVNRKREH